MGRLLLVRHGESVGNQFQRFAVTPDVPLTDRGRAQARAAGEWLRARHAPRVVSTSPFARARETAEIIATVLGVPVAVEDDLRERCYGALAGMPYGTPRPDYDPAEYWIWRPDGGETLVEVARRVGAVLDRLAGGRADDDVVCVSHGAAMTAALWHVTGRWPRAGTVVRNAGVVVVEHEAGVWWSAMEIAEEQAG